MRKLGSWYYENNFEFKARRTYFARVLNIPEILKGGWIEYNNNNIVPPSKITVIYSKRYNEFPISIKLEGDVKIYTEYYCSDNLISIVGSELEVEKFYRSQVDQIETTVNIYFEKIRNNLRKLIISEEMILSKETSCSDEYYGVGIPSKFLTKSYNLARHTFPPIPLEHHPDDRPFSISSIKSAFCEINKRVPNHVLDLDNWPVYYISCDNYSQAADQWNLAVLKEIDRTYLDGEIWVRKIKDMIP